MKTLSRNLSVAALFAWGSLMIYFFLSGRLTNYVAPFLKPLVVLSGVFLLAIGLCVLFGGKQLTGALSTEESGSALYAPARVRATKWIAFLLLVVPVWVAAGVSKDRYGDSAILNKGISNTLSPGYAGKSNLVPAPAANNNPLPAAVEPPLPGATPLPPDANSALDASQYLKTTADGHVIAEVTDLLFAAEDESMRPLFEKRTVEMIGQFLPVKNASDNRFQIVRMFMVCCAADARPIAVSVLPPVQTDSKTAAAKAPVEMAWTRVVGTVEFPLENGRRIPIIHAQTATPCDPPSEAMLY